MNQTIALTGLDPVEMILSNRSTQGSAEFQNEYGGKTYQFISKENQEKFGKNPEGFAPQFNGHCALAMSLGKIETAGGKSWKVEDGKLYLFLNPIAKLVWRILPGRASNASNHWLKSGAA